VELVFLSGDHFAQDHGSVRSGLIAGVRKRATAEARAAQVRCPGDRPTGLTADMVRGTLPEGGTGSPAEDHGRTGSKAADGSPTEIPADTDARGLRRRQLHLVPTTRTTTTFF